MGVFEALSNFLKSPTPPELKRGQKMKPREWKREPERRLVKEVREMVPEYELKPWEHPLALQYQPKLKGRGGEHLVFEVADSPDVVVKVEKTSILEALELLGKSKETREESEDELERRQQERLKEQRRLFTALKKHFGAEHVLPQKKALVSVPLTPGLMSDLRAMNDKKPVRIPGGVTEVKTIVTVQRKAEVLEGVRYFGLRTGAGERYLLPQVGKDARVRYQYRKVTEPLMSAKTAESYPSDPIALAELLESDDLERLLKKAKQEPGLREALKDFCERAIAFADETGEIIDLVGVDNVVFYPTLHGKWTYLLVDPFYGLEARALDLGRETYMKTQLGVPMNNKTGNAFFQSVNFVRVVNGIGKFVGSEKLYDYLPSDDGQPPDVVGALWPSLKRTAKKSGERGCLMSYG